MYKKFLLNNYNFTTKFMVVFTYIIGSKANFIVFFHKYNILYTMSDTVMSFCNSHEIYSQHETTKHKTKNITTISYMYSWDHFMLTVQSTFCWTQKHQVTHLNKDLVLLVNIS